MKGAVRYGLGTFPSPTRAHFAVRLAPWDGEVGLSQRRPEWHRSEEDEA